MTRSLRSALGILVDLTILAFGLVLAARGFVVAAALPLVAGGVDLAGRLGLLPFARSGSLTSRERGDLTWGILLALVGAAVLLEEAVSLVNGGRGPRHVAALTVGGAALLGALVLFVRLVRARARRSPSA